MIRAGELRQRMTIEGPQRVANSVNEREVSWAPVCDIWVKLETISEKEAFADGKVRTVRTHKITARYTSELTADRRLVMGSRVFDIVGVVNVDERDVELRVDAREQV